MVGIAILNSVFGMRDFFFFFYKRKKIFFGQLIRLDCSPGAQNHNAERYIRLLLIFLEEFCFPYYTFLVSAETTPFNSFLTLNFVYFSLSLFNFRINNNFMFILAFLFFLFIFSSFIWSFFSFWVPFGFLFFYIKWGEGHVIFWISMLIHLGSLSLSLLTKKTPTNWKFPWNSG